MDWLKRNWYWVIPAACLVGYFLWMYVKAKLEISKKMEKVREAKETKAILTDTENVSNN